MYNCPPEAPSAPVNDTVTHSKRHSSSPDLEKRMRAEVRDIGIPPRPSILEKIDQEMEKDDPDFRYLADLIGRDVALAAGLIKTTNSPFFGFSKKVTSVGEALLVLGLKVIVRTVAGLSLRQAFPKVPSLERFWDASATSARVTGWLASELGRPGGIRPDDAYTFGLFRDCGIPVLMIPFPEYPSILKAANENGTRSFTEVEEDALFINHAAVGAELAENWLLPEEVHDAIRHHHELAALSDANPRTAQLIALAQTAEYLIQQVTGQNQTREWEKLGPACLTTLGLNEDDLPRFLAGARPVINEAE